MVRFLPARIKRDVKVKSYVCELIIKIINGSLKAQELVKAFEALGYTFHPPLYESECANILENIVVEEFSNSHPTNKPTRRKSIGLGPLAIDLVCKITGLPDDKIGRGLPLIYNLPILNSYSRIEELYLKLTQKTLTMKE